MEKCAIQTIKVLMTPLFLVYHKYANTIWEDWKDSLKLKAIILNWYSLMSLHYHFKTLIIFVRITQRRK